MVLSTLMTSICTFLALLTLPFRSRLSMQLEVLALRHQLTVYQRAGTKRRLRPADRIFWAWLSRVWLGWQQAPVFVQPATVTAWQRKRSREHWTRLSRQRRPGRLATAPEIRQLIRRMSRANPTWGAPHILGELGKLGIVLAEATVRKCMLRRRKPPSPTWRAFLSNHVEDLVAIDFFVVPTVRFRVLFVFVVLHHHRRRVLHFAVAENPTAQWTAQQMAEAFPWGEAPRYLLRDRDGVYGRHHPRRVLRGYLSYYHDWRTHLSLDRDCPEHRQIQDAEAGEVIEVPEVGGLHHHYERRAA